ncbi:MAG: MmpS family transport accessory protein [Mangrovibacterium sp.]
MKTISLKTISLKTIQIAMAVVFLGTVLFSCGKDDDDTPTPDSRVVKYELTGTYSGTLLVSYTNADGETQLVDKVTLPWSKEVTVKAGPVTVGVGASSETTGFGAAGQTLTGTLSVGGVVKKTTTVNSLSTGYIALSNIAYVLY